MRRRETSSTFRIGNLRFERRGAINQRRFVVERDDPHLIQWEPEREAAGLRHDEETSEPLVRATREQ